MTKIDMTTAEPSYPTPYYAVIFTSTLTAEDPAYQATAAQMETLAEQQAGYLGIETARSGMQGITISYWQTQAAIKAWKAQLEHQTAQQRGRDFWYQHYRVRVAKVERDYEYTADPAPG